MKMLSVMLVTILSLVATSTPAAACGEVSVCGITASVLFPLGEKVGSKWFVAALDANQDGVLGISDFNAFRQRYVEECSSCQQLREVDTRRGFCGVGDAFPLGTQFGTPGYISAVDYNNDGVIGISDFNEYRKMYVARCQAAVTGTTTTLR